MRKSKQVTPGRKCRICGKPGGSGFTTALRLAGYDVPQGEISYAHSPCMQKAKRKSIVPIGERLDGNGNVPKVRTPRADQEKRVHSEPRYPTREAQPEVRIS